MPKPPAVPAPLVVALGLVVVEAVVLLALAVLELSALDSARLGMGVTTTAFFAVYALALLWCARALWRADGWARSPVVMAQLIQLGVAWSFVGGDTTGVAVGLAVVAVVVLAGIFHPRSMAALDTEEP